MKIFNKKDKAPERSLLAIVSSDEVNNAVEKITTVMPGLDLKIKKTDDTLQNGGTLVNGSADLVLIEADLDDERCEPALEKLCNYVGISGSLIVVAESPSPAQIRNLFKMGVSDVLSLPISQSDLQQSVQSLLGKAPQIRVRPAAGRVISFVNCGGGAGATTLATNIGHELSSRSKKLSSTAPKTLVIDLDLQFGVVATSLNAKGKTTLLDLIMATDRMDASLVLATVRKISDDLDVLAAPEGIVPLSAITPDFLDKLLDMSRTIYDYILLDLPQNWTGWSTKALSQSDLIIPVMTPTVEHVQNAQKILEGLDNLQAERGKTFFIINRVSKGLSHKDRLRKIESVLRRPSFTIADDPKPHVLARNTGDLLFNVSGGASYVKSVGQCVDKILAQINSISSDNGHAPVQDAGGAQLSLR